MAVLVQLGFNMENVTPEYQMAYFNNILLYYILRAVTNEQLAKDIWEEARKQAFPPVCIIPPG